MAKSLLGIEIGDYSVKLAVTKEARVERIVRRELPDNMVRQGNITSWEAMADFLKNILKEEKISCKDAAVVLPESLTYVRSVTMPAMTIEQLKVNLPYEFRDYISEEKDKYFYDYAVVEMHRDEDGHPTSMDLMAAAVKKSVIEQYRNLCKRAGLKLVVAAPEAAALQNIVHRVMRRSGKKQDFALLDLAHEAIRLSIFTNGEYDVARNMEPGCSALTGIAEEVFDVDMHIALLHVQKNYQNIWNHDNAVGLYSRIAVEIMRVINFYGFNHPDHSLENVYYYGGGSKITPLLEEIRGTIEQELISLDHLFESDELVGTQIMESPAAVGITWK